MKVVATTKISDAVLLSSTVPENDQPAWSADATYAIGTRVILASTHRVYEAVKASTGANPATDTTAWLDVGPTNRWAMFDQAVGTLTTATDQIIIRLAPDGLFDALAVLETDAALVRVQTFLNDVQIGNVTRDGPGPGNDPATLLFTGLPSRRGAQYLVTLTGTGTIGAGSVVVGSSVDIGITETGVSVGINDFSRREQDDFGVTTVVARGYAKKMTVKTMIETSDADRILRRLTDLRARPSLWIGEEEFDSLAIYGFYKDFQVDLNVGAKSYLSLTIEGFTDGGTTPQAITTPTDPEDPLVYVGIHNQYYSVANEKVLSGEQFDSGRFHRAMLSVCDPDGKNFGKRLGLDEDAGSWSGEAIPVNDPITGALLPPEYLRRKGAWLINSRASYMGAESFLDPRTKVALIGNLASGLWVEGNPGRTLVCKGARDVHNIFFAKPAKQGDLYELDERFRAITDITLKNMVLLDEVYRWGFFESMAMIRLCGVDGFNIEGIKGYGHRGDFLDIAMSDVGWIEIVRPDGSIERKNNENYHNANGAIRDVFIDGYNRNNRNPITVLDCDSLLIERVNTRECCKEGGRGVVPFDSMRHDSGLQMPSSLLDVEPNIEVKNPICRDVTLRGCRAQDGGGDGVNIFVRANADIPVKQSGFIIDGNVFERIRSGLAVFAVENSADPYGIRYENNQVRECERPHQVLRAETLFIRNNLFEKNKHNGDAGYEISPGVFLPMAHSEIVGNTYRENGSEGAGAFVVSASNGLLIAGNTLDRNSKAGYIHRGGGHNAGYTTRDNTFIPDDDPEPVAIGVVTSNGQTPTFDLASCLEQDNVYNGLPNFGLMIPGSRMVPTAGGLFTPLGPWPRGATIRGEEGAGGGEIVTARVAKAGVGTGTGNTGSGNDAPVWEVIRGNGGLFSAVPTGGVVNDFPKRKPWAMRQQGSRFTALARTDNNIAISYTYYPAGPISAYLVVPYRGIHGVAAGISYRMFNPDTATDASLLACVQLLGDYAQVLKKGVLQNGLVDPSTGKAYPNRIPIQAGMTIRIDYNGQAGQAAYYLLPEDGAAPIQFGMTFDAGSNAELMAIIRMSVAREFVDFYG